MIRTQVCLTLEPVPFRGGPHLPTEAQWERPVPFTQGPGQRPELCGKPMVSVNFLLQQLLHLFSFG